MSAATASTEVKPSQSGRDGSMTVKALASVAGCTPDTVRYYDKVGLLPPPQRSPAGYRMYTTESVDRLKFIQGAQCLGLQLSEIAELLSVRDNGICPCGDAAVLLSQRMAEIDNEIRRLSELRATLAQMVSRIPSADCPDGSRRVEASQHRKISVQAKRHNPA